MCGQVLAPVLFPHSRSVLFGDVKCITKSGRMPCSAFRATAADDFQPPTTPSTADAADGNSASSADLAVPMNPKFFSRSIEGEVRPPF